MKKVIFLLIMVVLIMPKTIRAVEKKIDVQKFIDGLTAKIEPAAKLWNLTQWEATTTGKKEAYKKYEDAENAYRKVLSDKEAFAKIKAYRKSDKNEDPLVKRQLDLLYLRFLENQIDPKLNAELVKMGSNLLKKFNTYRAKIDGVETPDNKIKGILKTSVDQKLRQEAWEASKQIGAEVADDLRALAKKRNLAAKELGYKNYYVMALELQEQSEKELFSLLDDLARMTDKPFKQLKSEIDTSLAKKFNINVSDLRPWHYEDVFFQEAPAVYNMDLDMFFKGKDNVKMVKNYFANIGLPTDDVYKRSDFFERKGKEQHAFCTDIDRLGDVRILANMKRDESWTSTLLHETGHAVYFKELDRKLPFLLREPAHIFTTEGIAELFGRFTNDPMWLETVAAPESKAKIEALKSNLKASLRARMLVFARWVEVMTHFEQALYANPDQDLNKLWWALVEKYQFIKKPEGRNSPDWAAKIHFTSAPVYYHNYLLGELFASQLTYYVDKHIAPKEVAFVNDKKLGEYFVTKVFAPAEKYRWDEFVKFATGEKFTPKYFAKQFLK